MTKEEREAVAELVRAGREHLAWQRDRGAAPFGVTEGVLLRSIDRVRALLAAPVTEPASVAELRGAIREERSAEQDYRRAHRDPDGSLFVLVSAAREHVDAILAHLDVTGPVGLPRDVALRIAREVQSNTADAAMTDNAAAFARKMDFVAVVDRHLGALEPVAQLGEADEESAAREAVVAAERAYLDARYAYEQAIEDAQSLPSDDPRKRRACEAEVRAWAALKAAIRAKKGAV